MLAEWVARLRELRLLMACLLAVAVLANVKVEDIGTQPGFVQQSQDFSASIHDVPRAQPHAQALVRRNNTEWDMLLQSRPQSTQGATGKFYIYEFQISRICLSPKLLGQVKSMYRRTGDIDLKQHTGSELFMLQQLEHHPWRTHDPEQADLFIVPSFLSLLGIGHTGKAHYAPFFCGGLSQKTVLQRLQREIEASIYYQRRGGVDHLLVTSHWQVRMTLYQLNKKFEPTAVHKSLNKVIQRFILGSILSDGAVSHGKATHWAPPRANVITVPYLSPAALGGCRSSGSYVVCADLKHESTFEEFLRNRPYTLFFIGDDTRDELPQNVRKLVIDKLGEVYPPNILASSNSKRRRPRCMFKRRRQQRTVGCAVTSFPRDMSAMSMLCNSRFSVHVGGDDVSSSRPYMALHADTPQIMIADRYLEEHAPFRHQLSYHKAFYNVSPDAFVSNPSETMMRALDALFGNESTVNLKTMWEAQREIAPDLLWHVPNSRVAHNIVVQALTIVAGSA